MGRTDTAGWAPLLDPDTAGRAVAAAAALASAVLADPALLDAPPSVASGGLGAALLLTALEEALPGRGYADAAVVVLDDAVAKAASQQRPDVALYGAPVGLGWAYAALRTRLPGGEPDDDENDVDAFVAKVVAVEPWPGPLDLAFGLTGLGTYALSRLPLPSARTSLERIVRQLAAKAETDELGVTWPFVPPTREAWEHLDLPEGHVDVGFAHGLAGILTFLAEADRAGVAGARELLEPAVRWLRAHRLPPGDYGAYPNAVVRGAQPMAARMAWCYGDPGVAVALLAAGEALDDPELVSEAREVAAGCAGRETGHVDDRTLCHGSAGLGHLFNRLGQALGDERLLDLARHWFRETLDGDLPEAGSGSGILLGGSGVGLALLSAAGVEPWWDPVLLIRPPASWTP